MSTDKVKTVGVEYIIILQTSICILYIWIVQFEWTVERITRVSYDRGLCPSQTLVRATCSEEIVPPSLSYEAFELPRVSSYRWRIYLSRRSGQSPAPRRWVCAAACSATAVDTVSLDRQNPSLIPPDTRRRPRAPDAEL